MILITGLTGKSGKWLLKQLVAESQSIKHLKFRATVRNTSKIIPIETNSLNFDYVIGDLFDTNFTDDIMQGVDTVLHIAGIGKSEIIIQAALKHHVKWVILVHTASIYSKYKAATLPYIAFEDRIAETLKNKNIDLTIIRPTMIYGSITDENMSIFIKMVDKLKFFPVVSGGKFPIQPVYDKDLGEAYFQILTNETKTKNKQYVLSGKEPISMIEAFKTIASYLGKKNLFISIPFPIAYFGAWVIFILSLCKIDYRERIQRMVESRAFPHNEALTDFGYCPVSFEEGIKDEINQYLELKKQNHK